MKWLINRELQKTKKDLKIYYIDADIKCISFINKQKADFEILGLTTVNFAKTQFNILQ